MADGSRSQSETEQLNQSSQERVRSRFPGRPRTLSGEEPQREITEQELQQNENCEAENTYESNETFNINENDFRAIESTDVGIHDAYNQGGVETTTFVAINFMQTKASVLGLAKLATSTTRSRAYHFFLVFLFF
ncbi:unnamed protein product [Prunus armeniaca]